MNKNKVCHLSNDKFAYADDHNVYIHDIHTKSSQHLGEHTDTVFFVKNISAQEFISISYPNDNNGKNTIKVWDIER